MSTKTTLKRIALVAVSALGFGVLSSVAPANAAWLTPTSITVGTPTAAVPGSPARIPVTFNLPTGYVDATDTFTVVARVTSAPDASTAISAPLSGAVAVRASSSTTQTSTAASYFAFSKPSAPTSGAYGTLADAANSSGASGTANGAANWTTANSFRPSNAAGDLAGQVTLNFNWTPDVAGTYTILFAVVPASAGLSTGNAITQTTATLASYTSASASVTTAGSPTTVTLTSMGGASAGTTVATGGALVRVTLGGGLLTEGQAIDLSSATTTVTFSKSKLVASDFTRGTAFVNVYNTAAGIATISANQSGTLTGLTSSSVAIEYVAASATASIDESTIGVTPAQTTYTSASASAPDDVAFTASTTRTTQTICVTNPEATVANGDLTSIVTFTDVSGKITGAANATFSVPVKVVASATAADRYACASVTATLLDGQSFFAVVNGGAATDRIRITGATRAADAITVTPTTSLRAAAKSSNTFVATVKDQFGGALAGRTIKISLVGRNAATIADAISDASGQVSYTVVDAGTSGTTDTLTFTDSVVSGATVAITITYGTVALTSMTLTGGNTTDGVTSATKSPKDIGAGVGGPSVSANRQTITATVADAAGSVAGVPISWTISGTGAAVLSTTATTYTNASGKASTSVYAWIAGTYTVTATGGGRTATAEITFSQQTAAEARTLTATASGQVITAKVVDRFGNPVSGDTIFASRTSGTGYFGNGVTKTSTTTDANGVAEFIAAGGDSTFRISTLSYDAAEGAVPGDQTCAAAGKVDCPVDGTAATSFTATTAGTTTTAETGVGASFAPAGVGTVSVTVKADTTTVDAVNAAADAAAEAIDAANAATDAANLAAEAADAATVAAEEARDAADAATAAVEELATQVATLMAALKAQITTLANTVAKIAKKVRA